MANPQLNFRLQRHQIAQGIQYILSLEPNQPLLSPSLIVKTIYLDTLAKATFNKPSYIPEKIYAAADAIINAKSLNQQTVLDAWHQASLEQLAIQEGELFVRNQSQQNAQPPQPQNIQNTPQQPSPQQLNSQNSSMQEQIQLIQQTLTELIQRQSPTSPPQNKSKQETITNHKNHPTLSEQELDEQINLMQNTAQTINQTSNQPKQKPLHAAPEECETESTITTVSDFSPPKEWTE